MPITWRGLGPGERKALITLAALHREFGPDTQWDTSAVEHVAGVPLIAEMAMLQLFGLADVLPDAQGGPPGYRLTGEGFAALPDSEERRALREHREAADQGLREEQ